MTDLTALLVVGGGGGGVLVFGILHRRLREGDDKEKPRTDLEFQ